MRRSHFAIALLLGAGLGGYLAWPGPEPRAPEAPDALPLTPRSAPEPPAAPPPERRREGAREPEEGVAPEAGASPRVTITGRVLDDYGRPLPGASVRTRGLVAAELYASGPVPSDAEGSFTIVAVDAARDAEAMAALGTGLTGEIGEGAAADPRRMREACIVFEHPRFRPRAEPIDLDGGAVELGPVSLARGRITLEGRVTNHRGEPLAARLEFTPSRARSREPPSPVRCSELGREHIATAGDDGAFSLALEDAGIYEVRVTTRKYRPRKLEVEVRDSPPPVSIRLD